MEVSSGMEGNRTVHFVFYRFCSACQQLILNNLFLLVETFIFCNGNEKSAYLTQVSCAWLSGSLIVVFTDVVPVIGNHCEVVIPNDLILVLTCIPVLLVAEGCNILPVTHEIGEWSHIATDSDRTTFEADGEVRSNLMTWGSHLSSPWFGECTV